MLWKLSRHILKITEKKKRSSVSLQRPQKHLIQSTRTGVGDRKEPQNNLQDFWSKLMSLIQNEDIPEAKSEVK